MKAEVIEVIKVTTTEGEGTKKDPVRVAVSYWEKNGKLIGKEYDSADPRKVVQLGAHTIKAGDSDMKVNIVCVKSEGDKYIAIPYDELTEEEKREQALKLTKRCCSVLGIEVREKTAG